jgi:hypothetical protein
MLAQAVYAATRREKGTAPMDHTVSVGNFLTRSFDRVHMPAPHLGVIPGKALRENAFTVRDAARDGSRFSGIVPPVGSKPGITPSRGGMYLSYDLRGQLAEVLHYATKSGARKPGNMLPTLQAFSKRCLVFCRPRNDFDLVTVYESGGATGHFYNAIQRHPDVKSSLAKLGYSDITQAIFSADDYSAPRGFSAGLEVDASIDGIAIGSARDFEAVGSAGNRFVTGNNIVLFGPDSQSLENRLKVVSVHTVDFDAPVAPGKWSVQTYEPNSVGDYVATRWVTP